MNKISDKLNIKEKQINPKYNKYEDLKGNNLSQKPIYKRINKT